MSRRSQLTLIFFLSATAIHAANLEITKTEDTVVQSQGINLKILGGVVPAAAARSGDILWINGFSTRIGPENQYRILLADEAVKSAFLLRAGSKEPVPVTLVPPRQQQAFNALYGEDAAGSDSDHGEGIARQESDIRDLLNAPKSDIRDLLRSESDIRDLLNAPKSDIRDLLRNPER